MYTIKTPCMEVGTPYVVNLFDKWNDVDRIYYLIVFYT